MPLISCMLLVVLSVRSSVSDESKISSPDYDARLGQFPFTVAIIYDILGSQPICTGVLLTTSIVLTACHCLTIKYQGKKYDIDLENHRYYILAGTVDVRVYNFETMRRIVDSYVPEECISWTRPNTLAPSDFGAAYLDSPFVVMHDRLSVVRFITFRLPKAKSWLDYIIHNEKEVTAVGFGGNDTTQAAVLPNYKLRFAYLFASHYQSGLCIVNAESSVYIDGISDKNWVKLSALSCANHPTKASGGEPTDSGGPIIFEGRVVGLMMGIIGPGVYVASHDTIFVRLDHMLPFIQSILQSDKNLLCDFLAQDLLAHGEFHDLNALLSSRAPSVRYFVHFGPCGLSFFGFLTAFQRV